MFGPSPLSTPLDGSTTTSGISTSLSLQDPCTLDGALRLALTNGTIVSISLQ
jgi:hypothetical protein